MGMNPCDFSRSLEEGFNSDFTEKLKLMLNINTMNNGGGEESQVGRPQKEGLEKSDKSEEVQDYVD